MQKQGTLSTYGLPPTIHGMPLTTQQTFALAVQHHQLGRLREAEALCRQILAEDPDHPQAHHNLGNALIALGRVEEAIAAYRRAVELLSSFPEARLHLGNALYQNGQMQEAMRVYQELLENWPDYPEAHNALGHLLK